MEQAFREKTQFSEGRYTVKPRILVAPLDWGLGHATRCIPVIRELLAQSCEVWLAGEGMQEELLRTEFPWLPFLQLPGYRVRYAKTGRGLLWKMIRQGPKIRRAIQYEHRWLKKMVSQHRLDAVISDNRYGLHHRDIPCIFITHQLTIKSSAGKWSEKILQRRNYNFIRKFTACWVPDNEGQNNLAGDLAHPTVTPPVPVHYIGWLSRFEKKSSPEKPALPAGRKDHLLVILSGPEPQRSILEEKIISDISHYNKTATIVRGLPGSSSLVPSTGMIKFYNHLPADALNAEMEEAEFVISRSGYSTVMDIAALQKKSILIPTPGQTEQEYLGTYLMSTHRAICVEQHRFSLNTMLALAKDFSYEMPALSSSALPATIRSFIDHCSGPALG